MLIIPTQYSSLELIGLITWPEIFAKWRAGEEYQEFWKKHWEERGWASWEEWREAYAAPLMPQELEWSLYAIKDPLNDLPFFYGTPTRGWVDKAYNGETTMQLSEVVRLPIVTDNDKVSAIKNDFPPVTMLTGLVFENKIVLVEGQHRACALASWDKNKDLNSVVTLALAVWPHKELPILGGNYKNKK